MEIDLKQLQKNDPLKRMVERQNETEELSPMEPPEAYEPPGGQKLDYDSLHPFLQKLVDEHEVCKQQLENFEGTLNEIRDKGPNKDRMAGISEFFKFLDESILQHNLKEEKILFPMLQERMVEKGDHSNGPAAKTAVDMLEDDHIKLMQLAAVAFNFIAMSARLPDPDSRVLVLDAGLEQGKGVVSMLRLHIFREDNVVFGMANEYLSQEELDQMMEAYSAWKVK